MKFKLLFCTFKLLFSAIKIHYIFIFDDDRITITLLSDPPPTSTENVNLHKRNLIIFECFFKGGSILKLKGPRCIVLICVACFNRFWTNPGSCPSSKFSASKSAETNHLRADSFFWCYVELFSQHSPRHKT